MASSSISFPHMNMQQRKPFPIERRPKLLKDFLNENSNSCSSSGFKSFPRHQPLESTPTNSNPNPKTASPTTNISAKFQALINAVKNIPFTTVKSPSFLPRSLSRRLSKRGSKSAKAKKEVKISVRVKDILRWTSFRDVAEAKPPPSDLSSSPNHYTITTTGSTIDSSSNSANSSSLSWCESDFTAEFLPSWCGNSDEKELKMSDKNLPSNVGVDYVDATLNTARDPQDGEFELYDEEEQQSPISVFDFRFGEKEEPFSTNFDQSLANVERTRQQLIQKIKEFESLSNYLERGIEFDDKEEEINRDNDEEIQEEEEEEEEKERAREMLVYVKATSSTKISRVEEELLFDFFRDELKSLENQYSKYSGYNWDMVTLAKAWMSGECEAFDHGLEHYHREAYISEINKVGNWSKFEVEQEGLALEIGDEMVGQLIDELLVDLLVK